MCSVLSNLITCAQGYTYDGHTCVYTSSSGSTYNCNNGFIWNGVSCISGVGSNCDTGSYWNGLQCVRLIT